MRQRVNVNTIKRSVQKLFVNDDKDLPPDTNDGLDEEEIKKKRLKKFLENYCRIDDKFKNITINPIYLYSEMIMKKILKLKQIFLEFDGDLSSK